VRAALILPLSSVIPFYLPFPPASGLKPLACFLPIAYRLMPIIPIDAPIPPSRMSFNRVGFWLDVMYPNFCANITASHDHGLCGHEQEPRTRLAKHGWIPRSGHVFVRTSEPG